MKWEEIDFTSYLPNDNELMNIARISGLIDEGDYINYLLNESAFENNEESNVVIKLSVVVSGKMLDSKKSNINSTIEDAA